ncbi:maleylpyruvate isomerase family mycothiol-dependent enzyme [Herbidospora sp. NEAU-GS84]|uniref:Maleylpyruvate isomerase family mycothiol-dependent enzyme n=1 Tax=Herbidospora solisilvae TaxID=2696284 RepID=A0A7C9J0Z7_9ACTN|nr:maleylpyruvate isomerase family mycothiol-dependent enzyme [Herbidospora solisilvae]NAS20660.1 maleylpyruvate isomerase family mycothiol-dependent enzyme [Herbidospora solisilvae]
MTIFGDPIDVRRLFPAERRALLDLLDGLAPGDWTRPTVCPGWDVHDVVAHVLHDYARRLSGSRDGHRGGGFHEGETLPVFLARVNDEFVRAARSLSPAVLVDQIRHLGVQLDAYWTTTDLDAPADLDVSWAATDVPSPAWLDVAREYTEFWVHQQQIRDAVSRPGALGADLAEPVADTFARALPFALREVVRAEGTSVVLKVGGREWSAVWRAGRWRMGAGSRAAEVSMDHDTFWRLASRGVTVEEARRRAAVSGDPELTDAATTLLAVVA